jgi:hypothetical protein
MERCRAMGPSIEQLPRPIVADCVPLGTDPGPKNPPGPAPSRGTLIDLYA